MTMDRHDALGAMLDEYALGQLSPDERRDVEVHVRECDVCAADLRELTTVMDGLAHSVDPATPPHALKPRVLAVLATQPQEPRSADAKIVTLPARPAAIRRGVHPAWLAAAAIVILGFGTLLYFTNAGRQLLIENVQDAQAEANEARAVASELQRRLDQNTGQADLAVSILTAADMRPIVMAGRESATGSVARAYWSPTRGLLVVADQLPTPPPGRIYQVWVIGASGPVSAGLLGAQGTGRGMLIAPPPGGVAPGAVTVAVTDEPPGGLPAPSGLVRLAGSI